MKRSARASRLTATPAATVVLTVASCICAPDAWACSCVPPGFGFIGPFTSRLPANAVGIPWYVASDRAFTRRDEDGRAVDDERFTLEILHEGQYLRIPLHITVARKLVNRFDRYRIYHIEPDNGLQPGAIYRVTDRLGSGGYGESHGGRQVVVEIDHEALSDDTPLSLYVSSARVDSLVVAADDAGCSGLVTASQARIAARLPSELRKWEDQLLFQTIVDGKRWVVRRSLCSHREPGRGWDDIAHDRVFAACEKPSFRPAIPLLRPGRHTVMVEARLPGTEIVLKTERKSVDLECADLGTP